MEENKVTELHIVCEYEIEYIEDDGTTLDRSIVSDYRIEVQKDLVGGFIDGHAIDYLRDIIKARIVEEEGVAPNNLVVLNIIPLPIIII